MKFLSDILAKAGLTVDGVVTLNNTATGQTPNANDNSTKLATTAWVRTFVQPYSLPIATSSVLGGIKVGTGLSIDAGTGVLSVSGGGSASIKSTQTFTATAGQTVFTISGGYSVGLIDVFLNGVYLSPNQTTATNGTTITLGDAALAGDIIDVIIASPVYQGATTTTDQLSEGSTNLYFTNARARAAISESVTGLDYNSATGVFSITTGYGIPTTASQTTWDAAYNDKINSAAVTGTTTKTLTLTQQDGGTITASWTDDNTDAVTSVFGRTGAVVATSGDYTTALVTEVTNLYYTDARARAAISVTGSGSYDSATGIITVTGGVTSVNTLTGAVTLTTTNIGEGTNLYYTTARANSDFDTRLGTKSTTNLAEGTNLYYTTARANSDFDTRLATKSTTNLAEGTNLYYTDTRVGTYLTGNSYATQSYVSTQINNLVSGAPGLLDTLDELAAALGDDPNFATTVTTALGNRLRIDTASQGLTGTQQGYGRTNLGLGSLATLSSIGDAYITDLAYSKLTGVPSTFAPSAHTHDDRYYTETEIGNFFSGASVITGYNKTNWDTAYGWGNHASGGYLTTASAASTYVSLSGSYANPSWITSLAYSKITGVPAFITSYTEVDTLATVTGRGASTSTAILINNSLSVNGGTVNLSTYTSSEARIADSSIHLMKTSAAGIFEAVRAMNADTTAGTTVRLVAAATSDPFNNTNGGKVFIDAVRTSTNMDLVFSLNDVSGAAPVERVRFTGGGNLIATGTISASNYSGTHSGASSGTNTGDQTLSGLGGVPTSGYAFGTAFTLGTMYVGTGEQFTPTTLLGVYSNGYAYKFPVAGVQAWLGLGSLAYSSATIPTNNNQLTNGAGYITSSGSITGTAGSTGLLTIDNSVVYGRSGLQFAQSANTAGNIASNHNTPTGDWWHVIRMNHANGAGYYADLAVSMTTNLGLSRRVISNGAQLSNWVTILDALNYNSYSPTLTGTGASGTWSINISGTAAVASIATDLNAADGTQINFNNVTNTDYSTMTFMSRAWSAVQGANGLAYNFTTHTNAGSGGYGALQIFYGESGYVLSPTSFRAPIFYDSANTAYYLDPNSTTSLRTVGSWRADSSTWDGEFSGKIQYHSNHWYIQAADLLIYRNSGGSNVFTVNQSGTVTATTFIGALSGNATTATTATTANNLAANTSPTIQVLNFTGVGGNSGNANQGYAIYQEGGSWAPPFPDLCIGYHTGIKIGAHYSYNGIRFYNNSDMVTETFSVGNGDNHVRVAYNLYVGGTISGSNLSGTNTGDQTNISGTASNITAYTINQSVGTGNSPTFAGLTVNTGGTGTWGPFVVTSTSQWGDGGTQYVTIGAGGAAGIMINNPHVVWNTGNGCAAIRIGRSGGTSAGKYYEVGTGPSDNFFIAKESLSSGTQLNINSSGNAVFSGTLSASNLSGTNTGDQTNISGNAATASSVAYSNISGRPGWMAAASLVEAHANANEFRNSGFYENSGGGSNWPSATWYNSINVRHSNQSNYHGFQVAMSYYDNLLWFRSYQGSGTFQSWAYAISSQNIGSQKADGALKLWATSHPTDYYIVNNWTGTYWQLTTNHGSGVQVAYANSAGSAGSASSATSAGYAGYLSTAYAGGQQTNPQVYFNNGVGLKAAMTGAWSVWSDTLWINGYAGGDVLQMCALHTLRNGTPRMAISVQASTSTSYGTFYEFITTYNMASQTAGNTNSISNALGNTHDWTAINYFVTNNGGQAVNNSNSAKLQAYSSGNNSAFMSFHKGGHYAINMGLDDDNVFRIGGWSASGNRLQMDMSGNLTMAGDVTAYSDARVKTNIQTIENALDKTLALRGVTYTRTDSEDTRTKIGVIAQETLPIVPEVVNQDNAGMYNVSYGNITALLIEAIKEQQVQIESQKSEIDELKGLVQQLINR